MTRPRVMPLPGCANDMEGQCAPWSSGDAHPSHAANRDSVTTCVLAPRPDVAGRDTRTETGATPPPDAPVVAWPVCVYAPHGPGEVAPVHGSLREGRWPDEDRNSPASRRSARRHTP